MQQGGSPYGTPPPPPPPPSSAPAGNSSYDELAGAVAADDVLGGGGSGGSGNRWPRQETLALLKIRSEMDAAFKDATLKGPLWEEVSRKLAELGYKRSGKKCKEKFENVHKYYKRTKEGRAGRQDGKSYRFFTQLEALHTTTAAAGAVSMPAATTTPTTSSIPANFQISAPTPITTAPPPPPLFPTGISFSSNTSSSSFGSESEEEDDEATEEGPMKEGGGGGRKRKREEKESGKMMAFFEGMMRQVMERQEAMQQKFLEAIEKREQDRMIREEAWRRQEMSRAAREHELAAQERAAAASRDAAILSFLQKVTGQPVPMPVPAPVPVSPVTPPAPPVNKSKSKPAKENAEVVFQQQQQQQLPPPQQQQTLPSAELVPIMSSEGAGAVAGPSSVDLASSSRWPKSEVHALINLRSELDSRYQESGPKGPLWEEISAGMKRLGYNRNAKRCKEKWENINKYFKKVKESNKKRPEDAKTCPYFHQLDVLYRRKHGSGTTSATPISMISSPPTAPAPAPAPPSQSQPQPQQTNDTGNTDENVEAGNGGIGSSYGDDSGILKKPEDIVKELMGQSTTTTTTTTIDYGKLDVDSENMDENDDDEEDDEDDDDNEDGKYRIQFQRPNVAANNSNGSGVGGGGGAPSNSSNTSGGKTSGSFLAMVR